MIYKISKNIWCLILTIILFLPSILYAQVDSLNVRDRILNSQESDQIFIQRTRNFILSSLNDNSISDAKQAYHYVINKYENEFTKPFWNDEKFLLGFWFGEYDYICEADSIENAIIMKIEQDINPTQDVLYPQSDMLSQQLRKITYNNRSTLLQKLDSLVEDREKHDYLTLFFDWLTFSVSEPTITEKKYLEYLHNNLTPRAEQFLSTYKSSVFRPFVKRHFRYIYTIGDWGYGYRLGLGSLMPSGNSEQYMKSEVSIDMAFELSWQDLMLDLGFTVGFPRPIKEPFIYDDEAWSTDVNYNYYTYYLTSGFVLSDAEYYKITPHIGISGVSMMIATGDKDKVDGDFSMHEVALKYGVSFDLKLGTGESYHTYNGLRFNLDYYNYLGDNTIMSGGMVGFSISWVGFARSIIRVF